MQEVDRTMLHMKDEAANFPDPNDRATQESEFSLELRTRDRERKLIRKIDEALKRIEDGSYGYCLETGEPITTEILRYGMRLATIGLPAHALLKTPEAMAVVGPACFGYPDLIFTPLAA
jgi:RNA polymerase-binding protein DksA